MAGYCCQISEKIVSFLGKGPGELGPIPGIGFSVKVFAKNVGKR